MLRLGGEVSNSENPDHYRLPSAEITGDVWPFISLFACVLQLLFMPD